MKKNNEIFFKLKSNDDGDGNGNENGKKKQQVLDGQNINFARAFFVHFFAVFVRLRRKIVLKIHVFV